MACPHLNFAAQVNVGRLQDGDGGPVTGYVADVHITCAECREQFVFIGLPGGYSPTEPMVSVDMTEARMPIRPASEVENPMLPRLHPGFRVRRSA